MEDTEFLAAFFSQALTVYITADTVAPAIISLDGRDTVLAFSQTAQLVEIVGAGSEFIEMRAEPLIEYCQIYGFALGFDFGLAHGRVLHGDDFDALAEIAKTHLATTSEAVNIAPTYSEPNSEIIELMGSMLLQLDSEFPVYYIVNNDSPTLVLAQGALDRSLANFFMLEEILKPYRGHHAVDIIVFKDNDPIFTAIATHAYKFVPNQPKPTVPILR